MSVIVARYPGKRPCVNCAGPIVSGQKIDGAKGAYRHADCADLAVYPITGHGGGKPKDPNAPMSPAQLSLIGELFSERHVTQGEASVIIDHLKSRPRRQVSEAEGLADNLRSAA